MNNKFKFVELDSSVELPKTKGKNIDGTRFYEVDGEHYPSVTSVLSIRSKEGIQKWRANIGEEVANYEMARANILLLLMIVLAITKYHLMKK